MSPAHVECLICLIAFVVMRRNQDVYGMVVDLTNAEFTPWTKLIDPFVFDNAQPYFNIMVPTADTTRYRISPLRQEVLLVK